MVCVLAQIISIMFLEVLFLVDFIIDTNLRQKEKVYGYYVVLKDWSIEAQKKDCKKITLKKSS